MEEYKVKVVGKRKPPSSPAECLELAEAMIAEVDLLNPYPRPRGFVAKSKTYAEYRVWRKNQKPSALVTTLTPPF